MTGPNGPGIVQKNIQKLSASSGALCPDDHQSDLSISGKLYTQSSVDRDTAYGSYPLPCVSQGSYSAVQTYYVNATEQIGRIGYEFNPDYSVSYRWEDISSGDWKAFDGNGRLTSFGNRNGVVGYVIYGGSNGTSVVGYADRNHNQVIWFEYNADGLISAVRDASNRRVQYQYTGGLLSGVTDVLGNATSFSYDAQSRLTGYVAPLGHERTITYTSDGVASVTAPGGRSYEFQYNYDDEKQEYYSYIKDSTGRVKEVWADQYGNAIRVDLNGETIKKVAFTYNLSNYAIRKEQITDGVGNVTLKAYDEWQNLTQLTYPDGSVVTWQYDHNINKPVNKTDERGIVTLYVYDSVGNLTNKTEAAGTASERVTQYVYDSAGNLLTATLKGSGGTPDAVTAYTYDALGNKITATDPDGNTTNYTYDLMGNMLTREDPRGKVWTYAYDLAGRPLSMTDPLGNVTSMERDALGKKIKEIGPDGAETAYQYDDQGNVTQVTDPLGNTSLFTYNFDNICLRTDPEGKTTTIRGYDLDGRLASQTDGNGNSTVYEYYDATVSCSSCSGVSIFQPQGNHLPDLCQGIRL